MVLKNKLQRKSSLFQISHKKTFRDYIRATLYACFMPCLIQLFFEKFQREIRSSIEIFRKIIELDKA